jgi:hypothetical protein
MAAEHCWYIPCRDDQAGPHRLIVRGALDGATTIQAWPAGDILTVTELGRSLLADIFASPQSPAGRDIRARDERPAGPLPQGRP